MQALFAVCFRGGFVPEGVRGRGRSWEALGTGLYVSASAGRMRCTGVICPLGCLLCGRGAASGHGSALSAGWGVLQGVIPGWFGGRAHPITNEVASPPAAPVADALADALANAPANAPANAGGARPRVQASPARGARDNAEQGH